MSRLPARVDSWAPRVDGNGIIAFAGRKLQFQSRQEVDCKLNETDQLMGTEGGREGEVEEQQTQYPTTVFNVSGSR